MKTYTKFVVLLVCLGALGVFGAGCGAGANAGHDSGMGGMDGGGGPAQNDGGAGSDGGEDPDVPTCAMYCACMQTTCAPHTPFASDSECNTTCENFDPRHLSCWMRFCEFAAFDPYLDHSCGHAAGLEGADECAF